MNEDNCDKTDKVFSFYVQSHTTWTVCSAIFLYNYVNVGMCTV